MTPEERKRLHMRLEGLRREAEIIEESLNDSMPPDRPPSFWGYVRVSTHDQALFGMSLEAQEGKIRRYFDALKINRPELTHLNWGGIFFDPAESAWKKPINQRKAGSKLCVRLRRGDHVAFTTVDRGFRSIADWANTTNLWQLRGVTIHITDYGIDVSTISGKIIASVLAMFAEIESDLRSARKLQSNAIAREKKRKTGGLVPWGYKEVKVHSSHNFKTLVLDRQKIAQIRWIVLLRNTTDMSWDNLADRIEEILAKREGRKVIHKVHQDKRVWTKNPMRLAYNRLNEFLSPGFGYFLAHQKEAWDAIRRGKS